MILLDGSALNIALPAIERDIGGSIAALQWLVNIYTIPLASLLLTAGVLADRVGSRSVFLWSLGGFTAASLLCAISPNLGLLAAFRCLQGIAAAGLLRQHWRSLHAPIRIRSRVPRQSRFGEQRAESHWSRTDRRRLAHRVHRLALDLLRQRPHRPSGSLAVLAACP